MERQTQVMFNSNLNQCYMDYSGKGTDYETAWLIQHTSSLSGQIIKKAKRFEDNHGKTTTSKGNVAFTMVKAIIPF